MADSKLHKRMAVPLALLLLIVLLTGAPVFAQNETEDSAAQKSEQKEEKKEKPPVWRVGIKDVPPFAYKDSAGKWLGVSVRLWEWVANDIGLVFEYEERDLEGLVKGVSSGELDAAVGALTITSEREEHLDFSHSYYHTGLGVAVKRKSRTGFAATFNSILKDSGIGTMGIILLALVPITLLIAVFERRYAAARPKKAQVARDSMWSSLWWTMVILIGKNTRHPASPGARILALSWMILSLIFVASLTALIASALTVTELKVNIEDPRDLVNSRLVTVGASTSEAFLSRERIGFITVENIQEGFAMLADGKADAIVYDKPVLRYYISENFPNQFKVLGFFFEPQDYGFAVKQGAAELEDINRSLLQRVESPFWKDVIYQYLGE